MARSKRVFENFIYEPQAQLFAVPTGAVVTAANAQQDSFRTSRGNVFNLTQGVGATGANTLLAANGLTSAANGWLLTLDNTATDSLEITNGIVLGPSPSFLTGTDSFYGRWTFLIGTLANITHLMCGFRTLGAYVTANTFVEYQTAYDDKVGLGISDNAGRVSRSVSIATVDATVNSATAAIAANVLAVEIAVSAARAVTCKVGTATPAGATAAQMETARLAAIAALAEDATISATAVTLTTAINMVPSLIVGASGAGACDFRLLSWDCGLQV